MFAGRVKNNIRWWRYAFRGRWQAVITAKKAILPSLRAILPQKKVFSHGYKQFSHVCGWFSHAFGVFSLTFVLFSRGRIYKMSGISGFYVCKLTFCQGITQKKWGGILSTPVKLINTKN
jgi:hypothetical protein